MRVGRVLCLLMLLLVWPAAARAAPADDAVSAIAGFQAVQADIAVPTVWTGSTAGCVVGVESPVSLAATLRTVNTLRAFAGVGPVTFEDGFNKKALAAALMMKAANDLTHSPDKNWPCYSTDGDDGARHSNLFRGRSGANAIVGFLQDKATESLGHRRWLLSPAAVTFGSGSTDNTSALYTVGQTKPVPAGTVVTWPPRGFVPGAWIFEYWSAAIGGSGQKVNLTGAQVRVTIDGVAAPVSEVAQAPPGFGFGQTLKWKVAVPPGLDQGAHKVDIAIDGVIIDGAPLSLPPAGQPIATTGTVTPALPRFAGKLLVRPTTGRNRALRAGMRVRAAVTVANARRVTYRWRRDGRSIRGATGRTYTIKRADRGHRLSVRVTARSATGAQIVRTSAARRVSRR